MATPSRDISTLCRPSDRDQVPGSSEAARHLTAIPHHGTSTTL